ncbi:hypothetical protein BDE02_18G088500 [Populus trichocarpa]|jgi:hypothetical protein|nr:hypothetical protein BDE02_18G088500 [Populus trichocarpa]
MRLALNIYIYSVVQFHRMKHGRPEIDYFNPDFLRFFFVLNNFVIDFVYKCVCVCVCVCCRRSNLNLNIATHYENESKLQEMQLQWCWRHEYFVYADGGFCPLLSSINETITVTLEVLFI